MIRCFQNGHTFQCDYESGSVPEITGGPFGTNIYKFAQFHLHWGSANTRGSEHTIDSQAFPMEIHFVHYNSKYASLGEAVGKSDGLGVFGAMFDPASVSTACGTSALDVNFCIM